jgi:hypothetical protein
MTFEVVDRPNRGSGSVPSELVRSLIETEKNGKALRVKLESHGQFVTWQAGLRATLKNHGLRLRTKFNKANNMVTCWAEKFVNRDGVDVGDIDTGVTAEENGDTIEE